MGRKCFRVTVVPYWRRNRLAHSAYRPAGFVFRGGRAPDTLPSENASAASPEVLFGLRQLHDVGGCIAQSQQLAPTGPSDRIIEGASPSSSGFNCAISYPPSGMCRVLNWRSFPRLRLPHFLGRLFRFPKPLTEFVQFGNLKKEIG
jgi:hypothetical protein